MRIKLCAACLACVSVLAGCANPSYSAMGGGKGQTMMMPTEIPSSNKLNEPVSKRKVDPNSEQAGQQAPQTPSGRPEHQVPPQEPPANGQPDASPDRAQL